MFSFAPFYIAATLNALWGVAIVFDIFTPNAEICSLIYVRKVSED